jgi:ABC-type sugar transport system ATPase subunit
VLNADVEVDRREFTVRAAVRVTQGGRLALFGPSGAGKTTVLEAIAGLVVPRRALISLGDRMLTSTDPPVVTVPPWRRRVGLLRQNPSLFPHLSVRDNLRYAPSASRSPAELSELAAVLGIDALLSTMPAQLSGGQAHRVALGRLLLARCDTLLLDEPYTGLDVSLRRTLTQLVSSLVAERSIPAILVTHELSDAQAFADRLAVIDRGELLQVGAPDEVVLRPASRRVAELVGYLGFVPAGDTLPAGDPGPAGDAGPAGDMEPARDAGPAGLVAGVHPERVIAGAAPGRGIVLAAVVEGTRPAGAGWEADLRIGGTGITCRLPDKPPEPGRPLTVTLLDPPLFDQTGEAVPAAPATAQRAAGRPDR